MSRRLPLFNSLGLTIMVWKTERELACLQITGEAIRVCRHCGSHRESRLKCLEDRAHHEMIWQATSKFRREHRELAALTSREIRLNVAEVGDWASQRAAQVKVAFYPWASHLPDQEHTDLPGHNYTFQPVFQVPQVECLVHFMMTRDPGEPIWVNA